MNQSSKKICLLIISQERFHSDSLETALIECQKQNMSLHVLYILDENFVEKIESLLTETTFVADKPGEDLCHALNKEYRQRAYKVFDTIKERCKNESVEFHSLIESGDYFELIKDFVDEKNPDLVIASQRKKSLLSKVLSRDDETQLKKIVTCDLKIF